MTSTPEQSLVQKYEKSLVDTFEDFQDPNQEWRRLFSELLGTFFLVARRRRRRDDGPGVSRTRSAARPPSSRRA